MKRDEYPRLKIIARILLAATASEAASERMFSDCGNIKTKKRNRLSPEHLGRIVFVKRNLLRHQDNEEMYMFF